MGHNRAQYVLAESDTSSVAFRCAQNTLKACHTPHALSASALAPLDRGLKLYGHAMYLIAPGGVKTRNEGRGSSDSSLMPHLDIPLLLSCLALAGWAVYRQVKRRSGLRLCMPVRKPWVKTPMCVQE